MADNYTSFSLQIENLTEAEIAWIKEFRLIEDPEEEWEVFSKMVPRADKDDFYGMGFNHSLDRDGWWIYSEDGGMSYNAGVVIRAFLAKFRPKEIVMFQWADTCSKPAIDQFGGGVVVVTAKEVFIETSYRAGERLKREAQSGRVRRFLRRLVG